MPGSLGVEAMLHGAEHFVDRSFVDHYGVKYAYYAGSMANAISSEVFIISLVYNCNFLTTKSQLFHFTY